MKVVAAATILVVSVASCATSSQIFSELESRSVKSAEDFMSRNGFTDLQRDTSKPVEFTGINDTLASLVKNPEDIAAERFGVSPQRASCLKSLSDGVTFVYFKATKNPGRYLSVYTKDGKAVQLAHVTVELDKRKVKCWN